MVDYKKAALFGAVGGAALSFVLGKKSRGFDFEKIAKYAAGGAGVVAAAGFVMSEAGKPLGLLAPRTGYDSWPSHVHPEDRPFHPMGHEHFHRW
jgi:hypothetical protein